MILQYLAIRSPDQRSAVAPFGQQVQLNCEVTSPHTIRHWHIIAGGRESFSTSDTENFNKRNITIVTISDTSSQLIVNSTEMNDNITIECHSRSSSTQSRSMSCPVYTIFFGKFYYTAGIVS